ncbi:hypothetical protein QRD89_16660 [Halobacillus sp. ACCC02827]|uniref:hypothetical protein n=1 Tax=Bacillaceae TaxID=186817 RepID=UPI0002A4D7C6|nr:MULTISPECIES: hypothetical protein [Bacillaceae]ELK49105.1 hypothetical protein D479_00725 [Halobacillus sp. BAB-2008]QHT48100.1 hypothetical protein M662_16980 [Bacillus sp. SB49]WJE15335.1 hypothetical protein QRD89_16660 [Halobacillus sp. ACCC02827]
MWSVVYYVLAVLIFSALWKGMDLVWNAFVPLNYKTNLIAVIFVIPLMIIISLLLASFIKKALKNG